MSSCTILKKIEFISGLIRIVHLTSLVLLLSACATQKNDLERDFDTGSEALKQALYAQFEEWREVRYRLGGLSRTGIDCSGFVYLTYRDLFNVVLPRTAYQQAGSGFEVSRRQLKAGDLIFFRTGYRQSHVGIYLEHRRFLHVSTRRGVAISSIDNRYWSGKFWKAVRVFSS